jgi:parallel beta-helix repeat protein
LWVAVRPVLFWPHKKCFGSKGLIKAKAIANVQVQEAGTGNVTGKNTDGNGIIYDTFRSYAGQSLCLGNIACHNGGKGIDVFRSGRVTVANNTAHNNNWDTYNPGT